MTDRRLVWIIAGGLAALAIIALVLAQLLTRPRDAAPVMETASAAPGTAPGAHIRATVFYIAPSGSRLSRTVREIALAETAEAQGSEVVNVALQAPRAPLLPAVPAGTTLRGFYIGDDGDAFVDLGGDGLKTAGGGTTAESLAVYAIVNTVTANLPAVKRVQILIDGTEVDTLAGHLDLRRPLSPSMALVQ